MTDRTDPLTRLEALRQGPHDLHPASAASLRERGDRIRRRRYAAAVGGAALAVALVATPLALLGSSDEGSAPRPARQPTPSVSPPPSASPSAPAGPTRVPAGFPLAAGWPTPDGDGSLVGPGPDAVDPDARACGARVTGTAGASDVLGARLELPAETRTRELRVYPSGQAASAASAELRALYEGCPRDEDTGIPPALLTRVTDGPRDGDSWTAQRQYDDDVAVGRSVIAVARAGNALLVDTASDEGTDAAALAAEQDAALDRPYAAMRDLVER